MSSASTSFGGGEVEQWEYVWTRRRTVVGPVDWVAPRGELSAMTTIDVRARFLERSRYYLCVEYPAKLRAALRAMPPDRVWWRANPSSNSAANLVLHLAGNVRQWMVSGVGGTADVRQRDAEFAATSEAMVGAGGDASVDALLARLDAACADAVAVLERIGVEALVEMRVIQGREVTVFAAVCHVVERFLGHTGQIFLIAKMTAPGMVRLCDDAAGLARPLFLPSGGCDVACGYATRMSARSFGQVMLAGLSVRRANSIRLDLPSTTSPLLL